MTVMTFWTIFGSYQWERIEVDEESGESVGRCNSKENQLWLTFLSIFALIPTGLTIYMAWKTKDVDDAYSETWWIFALVMIQAQAVVLALPLVVILRDVSTNGRHVGFVMLLWIVSMSTVTLIMLPKVLAYYGIYGTNNTTRRGARSNGPQVTGISIPQAEVQYVTNATTTIPTTATISQVGREPNNSVPPSYSQNYSTVPGTTSTAPIPSTTTISPQTETEEIDDDTLNGTTARDDTP